MIVAAHELAPGGHVVESVGGGLRCVLALLPGVERLAGDSQDGGQFDVGCGGCRCRPLPVTSAWRLLVRCTGCNRKSRAW